MKKIVILVLIISLLTTSVFAVENNTGTMVNLLDQYSTFTFFNDYYDFESSIPYADLVSDVEHEYASISFGTEETYYYFDELYLYFCSYSTEVNSIRLSLYDGSTSHYYDGDLTLVNVDSNGRYYYQASFYPGIKFNDLYTFRFGFDQTSSFSIELLNLNTYPVFNAIVPVDELELDVNCFYINREDSSYYRQNLFNDNITLPYAYHLAKEPTGELIADNALYLFLRYYVPDGSVFDKFQFSFVTTGIWNNYYDNKLFSGGVYLNTYAESRNLDYIIDSSYLDSSWYGLPVYRHTITIDTSGIDFTDAYIEFSTMLQARFPYTNNDYTDYWIRFDNAYQFINSAVDAPWYRIFWNWCDNLFSNLFSNLNNVIINQFDLLSNKLDDIFKQDDSGQSSAVADAVDGMNNASNEFAQAGDQIEALMPSFPGYADSGLSNFSEDAVIRIEETQPFFETLWQNDIIITILGFAAFASLGGFLLFGER